MTFIKTIDFDQAEGWMGRYLGKKEGFDYEARMNQDLIEEIE